jgi:ribosome silencing factor RsfS/YbeB/iojap
MEMKKMSSVCDFFVIASGTSTTHVRAISDSIIEKLKAKGHPVYHKEGEREASWILLDFGDVVCHVFLGETRAYYGLETLWARPPKKARSAKSAARKVKAKAKAKAKRPAAKKKKRRSKK